MKIYISVDIEGITNVTHQDEILKGKPGYEEARTQMTAEAVAACEGALQAGAREIWVKDAHGTGRNLIPSRLPHEARLIRAWSEDPLPMMQELDESFDAVMLIGYHSGTGRAANPLEHTFTGRFSFIRLNGQETSEFTLNAYYAEYRQIPVVLVTGDEGVCSEALDLNPQITSVSVMKGIGGSTVSMHPTLACQRIQEAATKALSNDLSVCRLELPDSFELEIGFRNHATANRMSFYPGAKRLGASTISYQAEDYFDIKRLILFAMLSAWS
ncbi:M55 family metallopeptidase [Candidatus Bipolaricaulota bacterium]|nr:M55 family metallopeptidase [Candidatus Bipolaricaulota bacterium]